MSYRTIVADPPWDYGADGARWPRGTTSAGPWTRHALPYQSLSVPEISALTIPAARDARLFLWTTNRYLPDAFGVVDAWGFEYRQTIVWAKVNASPFAGSVAPNDAEYLLVCRRGQPERLSVLPSCVVSATSPRDHSRKPELFLDLVESVSPGPYLELFARRQRLGWDTWGNEALEHVALDAPALHRLDGCA